MQSATLLVLFAFVVYCELETGGNTGWFTSWHQILKNPKWNQFSNPFPVGRKEHTLGFDSIKMDFTPRFTLQLLGMTTFMTFVSKCTFFFYIRQAFFLFLSLQTIYVQESQSNTIINQVIKQVQDRLNGVKSWSPVTIHVELDVFPVSVCMSSCLVSSVYSGMSSYQDEVFTEDDWIKPNVQKQQNLDKKVNWNKYMMPSCYP